MVSEGNLVAIGSVVNDCLLSKTAKFCRKWLPPSLLFAPDRPAVSCWCGAVFPPEVAHEVSVRRNPDLLQDLLDAEKRRAQHLFCFHQPDVFKILRRSRSGFLFK